MIMQPSALLAGAILGFTGVALGAWGAHGAHFDPQAASWWQTGVHYHQLHAVVVALVSIAPPSRTLRVALVLFVVGAVIFAGTLYAMALGGPRMLGAVTPLGGLGLLVGWACLGVHALAHLRRSRSG